MDPAEVAVAAIIFGTTSVTTITLARMRMQSKERRQWLPDASVEERLERIEQAVDAIALEVERMSESQRFTSRVLAERLPSPGPLPGGERGTP